MDSTEHDELDRIALLLGRVNSGEPGALAEVFDATYTELCNLARARLRGGSGAPHGLETAMLVHEVFLRLVQRGELPAERRGHFFKYAGRVMRSVIVDLARERMALCRGGGASHAIWSDEAGLADPRADQDIVRVHEALDELAEVDPELTQIVQMRFFTGLSDDEIASALGVTDRTVRRRWERARAFLLQALGT